MQRFNKKNAPQQIFTSNDKHSKLQHQDIRETALMTVLATKFFKKSFPISKTHWYNRHSKFAQYKCSVA
jgi:hypothetical protein